MRIIKQNITEEMQLGRYLSRVLLLSEKQISRAKFRKNGICVNGVRQRITYQLHAGDLLEVKLEEEDARSGKVLPFAGELTIIWEDEDILAVNKPAGMAVHPSHGHYRDTLANLVVSHELAHGRKTRVRAVGRLDKETSGIVLFAKNQLAAARLAKQRESGELTKTYLAVASGRVEPETGVITLPIRKQPGSLMKMEAVQPEPGSQGKAAVTSYRVLRYGETHTLLEAWIATGRTHQIRVHFAAIGYPLLGDGLYGGPLDRLSRAALHAQKLTFLHPISGESICLEASLPDDLREI